MIKTIYFSIVGLLALGAILLVIIHKKNPTVDRKQNWIKYGTFILIVNALFATALFYPKGFWMVTLVILIFGWVELIILFRKNPISGLSLVSVSMYATLNYTFYEFSFLEQKWLIFTLFVIFLFDAFSQLTGQLLGKTKILPRISPNKTVEGTIGGIVVTLLLMLALRLPLDIGLRQSLILTVLISLFAFTGDLLASLVKRMVGVKDFSQFIPGHGGFLDRFDSHIFVSLLWFLLSKFWVL